MPASAAAEKQEAAHRFAKDQLKSVIERIERLEEEKKATSDDIREVYASTSRRCARSCGCASRTSTSARKKKPCLKPTCTRWGC